MLEGVEGDQFHDMVVTAVFDSEFTICGGGCKYAEIKAMVLLHIHLFELLFYGF